MVYDTGSHPGAVWWRIDAQCHTPRDRSWSGSAELPGGTPELEAARREWAAEFVQAAVDRQLTMVAITDHHDIAFIPYVIDAAANLKSPSKLVVLPGVEVTCSDAVQCLALFDPEATPDDWSRFLAKLPTVEPASADDAKTCPTQQAGCSTADLMNAVERDEVLRDKLIILPHFGNESAHKSLNVTSQGPRVKALLCDAVYIETRYQDLEQATLDKVQGRIEDWGTRRKAILATGDNKTATWDRLGAHECWIKLGEISTEGFRQAFLADEARIAFLEPERPSERILEFEVLSDLTGASPLICTFNDGFNGFIGGRGSGKSSMLEYLRFGLGKSELDLTSDDKERRNRREREANLINETLSDGYVQITLDREGVVERWRRYGAAPERIEVQLSHQPLEVITVAEAQRRFPARAFHQKELSTTMVDLASAADNLTGIAAAEVIDQRRQIDQEISNARRGVSTALQSAAAHWQSQLELNEASGHAADIRRRLDAVKQKLELGGVQQADLETLADASRYGAARNYLREVERRIEETKTAISELQRTQTGVDGQRHPQAMTFPSIKALDDDVATARSDVQRLLGEARVKLDQLEDARTTTAAIFVAEETDFEGKYAAAKERQSEHRSLIADAERLTKDLSSASAVVDRAQEKFERTSTSVEKLTEAQAHLSDLLAKRQDLLTATAAEVANKSEGTLKARVKRDRQPADAVEALCQLLEGSRFREAEQHCSEWVASTMREDGLGWVTVADGILDIYRNKILAGGQSEPGSTARTKLIALLFNGEVSLTELQLTKIYQNLDDQSVGEVLSATPRDTIVLTYVSEGVDIPFSRASPGQQASALLRLLLRQSAGTLIIDQPEDDLDNRVMMDIVRLVRTSKSHRQLIFATHNSNLVVNGDADKVVTMTARVPEDRGQEMDARIRILCDGAIETPAVQKSITKIMEGGIEAFELRARKYNVEDRA